MSCSVGTDARLAVDIEQISMSDSCRCEKELTQSHVIHHFKLYFFFALGAAVTLALGAGLIIAAAVTLAAPHCARD